MSETRAANNRVTISGEIVSGFEFDHEVCGEKFYSAELESKRKSDQTDTLRIIVSERLADINADWVGSRVLIHGEFRSYNKHEENRNRLILFIFVQDIEMYDDEYDINQIEINAFICKEPKFRTTPLGRDISDVLLAVNRQYGKSDYIPTIFWGRNAEYISSKEVGTRINVTGRIQSRNYTKSLDNGEVINRTAYEVSVGRFSIEEE